MDHEILHSGGLTLHKDRVVSAPAARVFAALTEPDELAKWWGPTGFTSPQVDIDLHVAGGYRIAMQPPDGKLFYLVGEFREIDPPGRVAYTFRWEDPDPDDQETVVTLSLRDLGAATELGLTQRPFTVERRRALHDAGWSQSLDRLEQVLSAGT